MAADFSAVTASLSADANTLSLSGKATTQVATPVHVTEVITADDGSTETVNTDGTRTVTKQQGVKLTSVSDDIGGKWTIAADGQSAKQG